MFTNLTPALAGKDLAAKVKQLFLPKEGLWLRGITKAEKRR
jgi:hypothetical protein